MVFDVFSKIDLNDKNVSEKDIKLYFSKLQYLNRHVLNINQNTRTVSLNEHKLYTKTSKHKNE